MSTEQMSWLKVAETPHSTNLYIQADLQERVAVYHSLSTQRLYLPGF
jgi:hypothetical protein